MSVRVAIVALAGFLVTFLITFDAYKRKKQFYPTVAYLSTHQPLIAIVCFELIVLAFLFAKLLTRIFFGTLQQAEMDNVVSQSWYTFFDMCLVFAFFQEELGAEFMILFSILLFVRSFHWLIEERVDYMERTPLINVLFHLRIQSLLFILGCVDIYFISTNYWIEVTPDSSVKLALGVEYYNLLFSLIIILVRYIMHSVDTMREHPWDKKAMYLLYVEILIGILRLYLYIEFTTIMWKIHPFPLFVARPIYLSVRTLKKAIRDVYMSQRAIRYLNTIFSNATAADLAASSDTVCIICREEMHAAEGDARGAPAGAAVPHASSLKRLPCSHIFHTNCLLSWFQRQQTCPTCRMHVLRQQARPQPDQAQPAPAGAAAAAPVGPGTAAPSAPAGTGNSGQAPGAGQPVDARPPWMLPGMPPPYFAFPHAPASDPNAATGQPAQGQQTAFPAVYPHMYMQPAFVGMPMIHPGPLFPPFTSPMPVPPADGLEGMSEAQLRASAIARFTALRQVNVLLRAAVLQMNAYLSAVTEPDNLCPGDEDFVTVDRTTANAHGTSTSSTSAAAASGDSVGVSVSGQPTASGSRARCEDEEGAKQEPDPEADKTTSYCETSEASTPDSSQPGNSDEKDLVVVRNRWLEKVESRKKESDEDVCGNAAK